MDLLDLDFHYMSHADQNEKLELYKEEALHKHSCRSKECLHIAIEKFVDWLCL